MFSNVWILTYCKQIIQHHFPWLGSPSEEGSFLWEAPASCLKECLWMLRALVLPDCDCRCTRCSELTSLLFMLFHAIGLVIVMSVRKRCQIGSWSFQCVEWKWTYTDTIGNFSKRWLESGQAEFGSDLYYIRCRFNDIFVTECYKSYGSFCFLAIICSSGWAPSCFKLLIQWIAMACRYLVAHDLGGFPEMWAKGC